MNVLDMVEEIVAARPVTPKPWGKKRHGGLHGGHVRPLTLDEICALKSHVLRRIDALNRSPTAYSPADGLCASSDVGAPFCWKLNCPRCMPA